jgi:CheY-like chemotaxis protein
MSTTTLRHTAHVGMDRRHPRTPSTRPLVLIVEGHEDTRALYSFALMGMGFEVIASSDCADGYSRASKVHPDIIVTELSLRQHDGLELLRDLKEDARTRDIPVVVLTGDDRPVVRERVAQVGGAVCLLKPCVPAALAVTLRHVLAATTSAQRISTVQ